MSPGETALLEMIRALAGVVGLLFLWVISLRLKMATFTELVKGIRDDVSELKSALVKHEENEDEMLNDLRKDMKSVNDNMLGLAVTVGKSARAGMILLAFFSMSCGAIRPPRPVPTPTPIPIPEPQCQEGQSHSCWHFPPDSTMPLYACPVKDSSGGVVGVINVTGGPAQCPKDPTPVPTPTPTPKPPVGTDCEPVLDAALLPPLNSDSWTFAADQGASFQSAVDDSIRKAQAACGTIWNQPATDSSCLISTSRIDQGYLTISKQLQLKGIRASQAVDASGRKYDHLYICRDERTCESWKLFEYGAGCLTGNPYKGAYLSPVGPTPPTPTPTPPPVTGCTDPLPPQKWTSETLPDGWDSGLVGHTRYIMGCTIHGKVVDCTVQNERACEYCDAIGMGSYADGQDRCGCPVRNECPGTYKCEERVACEAYLAGGTVLEARNGATCEFANNNPYQFYPSGGNCRLCGANGTVYNGQKQGCGGWF